MDTKSSTTRRPRRVSFPIRFKILVTLLLLITGVLGTITFTMANLFHADKRTYINDLTSVMALGTAEECRSMLTAYQDRLESCARVMYDPDLSSAQKRALLKGFFDDFEELVGLAMYEDGALAASAYDGVSLEAAGVSREAIETRLEASPTRGATLGDGEMHIENSTVSANLPTLTMSLREEDRGRTFVLSAMIALDDLVELAARSRLFDTYIVDGDGRLLAHHDAGRVVRRERIASVAGIPNAIGRGSAIVSSTTSPEGEPLIAGYALVGIGNVVAIVEIPQSAVYLASRSLLGNLIVLSLVLLAAAAIVSSLGARRITHPIERLLAATRAIGRGQFDVQVDVGSRDEIGSLAESFNGMARELDERERALRNAQSQLIQSEKLAALGELGAAIAHEVKNPLAGILVCAQQSMRKKGDASALDRNLTLIEKETKRCKTIVENLLKFARSDKPVMEDLDINRVVSDTDAIVRHQLEMHRVGLELALAPDLPPVRANANQLQQVLMNVLMNAQQAMEETGGAVEVETAMAGDGHVSIHVRDDGPGMPDDVKQRVFDPFFTTKPRGKGTGLGMSVSFGIVRDLGGEITVDSQVGEGTEFVITLPISRGAREGDRSDAEAAA